MASDSLGLQALGELVDLIERLRASAAGIHIVVTDRPEAVRAALEARLPAGYAMRPLANDARDGLHSGVYTPPAPPAAQVLVDALDPRSPDQHKLLTALNVEREWLMVPGNHAVLLITGRTLEDAGDAYLDLHSKAPDLWSLRASTCRAGGPDSDAGARARLRDQVAERLGGGRAADDLLSRADLPAAWEQHRLWRSPRHVDAWLAGEDSAPTPRVSAGGMELIEPGAPVLSLAPIGEPLPRDALPRPRWPSGKLDDEGQLLVDAMTERLEHQRRVRLYVLPDRDEADRLRDCALTVAMLHAARFGAVVHLDVRDGLARAAEQWLAAADPEHAPSSTHGQALQRMAGALRGHRVLIVLTHADATDADLVALALAEHGLIAVVQPRPRAALAVCHHIDRSDWGMWCADQLRPWPMGAMPILWSGRSGKTLVLALREALAVARAVIVLSGATPGVPEAWAVAEPTRGRVAALLLGDAAIPPGAEAFTWTRLHPSDENAAREQLVQVARELAGPPLDLEPGPAPFPGAPEVVPEAMPEAMIELPAPEPTGAPDPELTRPMLGGLLRSGVAPLPEEPTPAQYLIPGFEVVPFVDRARELDALHAWAESGPPVSVQLIHGRAGAGKTRLAIEWIKQRRARGDTAGWLEGALAPAVIDLLVQAERATVVIDSAEIRAGLGDLLRRLAEVAATDDAPRLRVVLLARNAGDWWHGLTRTQPVAALAEAPMRLDPLVSASGRAAEFARAAQYLARAAGRPVPSRVPELGAPRFDVVLELHAAALAEVLGASALDRDPLLDREVSAWLGRAAWDRGDPAARTAFRAAAEDAMAAITLRGGVDSAALHALLARIAPSHAVELARLFAALYPQPPDGVAPLQPDVLSETLIARVLERHEPGYLEDVFEDAGPDALRAGLLLLARISIERPEPARAWLASVLDADVPGRAETAFEVALAMGEESAFSPLGQVLAASLRQAGTTALARTLEGKLPEHTVSLREVKAWVCEMLLQALPARDDEETQATRARLWNNLGAIYGALGKREDDVKASLESVEHYRKLAQARPDAFLPNLAGSLNNLGTAFSRLGKREEALAATAEGVQLYRDLAQARPDAFLPSLAGSINNLGIRSSELGKHEEAMAAAAEAVQLYRNLAQARPDAFLPNLARSLNNLGIRYSELGKREEALAATLEAVQIHRNLAQARPDAFLPNLAGSLSNLGIRYSELGKHEEAMAATAEAVQLHRNLAQALPDAFLPDLARSVNNLGAICSELGKHEEALAAAREAVAYYCDLASELPAVFMQDLQGNTGNLIRYLDALGRDHTSEPTLQRALKRLQSPAE